MNKAQRELNRMKAELVKAAAHPIRIAVIDCLRDGERCVCEITRHVGAGRPNVSRHLALMTRVGLLDSRKEGLRVIYRLKAPCVVSVLPCVTEVIREQLKENAKALQQL